MGMTLTEVLACRLWSQTAACRPHGLGNLCLEVFVTAVDRMVAVEPDW